MSLRLAGGARIAALWVATSAAAGCSIDSEGEGRAADGGLADGEMADGLVAPSDAGPPCTSFGAPRVVAVLDRDEFEAPGAELSAAEVDAAGHVLLAGEPYRYGALSWTSFDDSLLDPVSPRFDDFEGAAPVLRALSPELERFYPGDETPPGLFGGALTAWSLLATGEIRLDPGTHVLGLTADDRAIVELRVGDASFATSVAGPGTAEPLTVEVPEPGGWYPIRVGWADDGFDAQLALTHTPPGGSEEEIAASDLRVDVSEILGREMFGWDYIPRGTVPDGARIDEGPATNIFTTLPYPAGIGITDENTFDVIWSGRELLTREHPVLTAAGNDRFRLWVDGVLLGDTDRGSYTLPLVDGWYDVVLELHRNNSGAPEIGLDQDGVPVQPAQMRPATRFGGLPLGVADETDANVDGDDEVDVSLELVVPDDAPCALEVSTVVDTKTPEALEVEVEHVTDGATFGPYPFAQSAYRVPHTDRHHFRTVLRGDELGGSAAGEWLLVLRNAGTVRATRRSAGLLAHHGCTGQPYPRMGAWRSAPIDLGADHELTRVIATSQRPFGTSVLPRIRTGRTLAELESAAGWRETDADFDLTSPVVARYVQVELALSGPGYDTPRVLDVRVVGRPCADCLDTGSCVEAVYDGLVALYTFDEPSGTRVRDLAGAGEPLDLAIADPAAVTRSPGVLTIDAPTLLRAIGPETRLYETLTASDAVTVEAVVHPRPTTQLTTEGPPVGPSRIVTYSFDEGARNFTLGQDGDEFQVRLRTATPGDDQGTPYLWSTSTAEDRPMRVAFTYDGSHIALYVDGVLDAESTEHTGTLDGWDPSMRFGIANEIDPAAPRPWTGDLHSIAIYDHALTPTQLGDGD